MVADLSRSSVRILIHVVVRAPTVTNHVITITPLVANFCAGVYLPLLWESTFCWKTPLALAYTRGHFSALVALTAPPQPHENGNHVTYLPLVDSEGRLLCVHYLNEEEVCLCVQYWSE